MKNAAMVLMLIRDAILEKRLYWSERSRDERFLAPYARRALGRHRSDWALMLEATR